MHALLEFERILRNHQQTHLTKKFRRKFKYVIVGVEGNIFDHELVIRKE